MKCLICNSPKNLHPIAWPTMHQDKHICSACLGEHMVLTQCGCGRFRDLDHLRKCWGVALRSLPPMIIQEHTGAQNDNGR